LTSGLGKEGDTDEAEGLSLEGFAEVEREGVAVARPVFKDFFPFSKIAPFVLALFPVLRGRRALLLN